MFFAGAGAAVIPFRGLGVRPVSTAALQSPDALFHGADLWDGDKLVGLIRALDDSEMLAQIHYVLVHPDYQGQGIAGEMLERIKEKYKNYLYIEGMPEDKKNVPFYEKHGFQRMEHGAAIQICNYSDKR